MNFIERVVTPTLIPHGKKGEDVPTNQGYELFRALKARGITTEMIIYPREPHDIAETQHVKDLILRVCDWFERHPSVSRFKSRHVKIVRMSVPQGRVNNPNIESSLNEKFSILQPTPRRSPTNCDGRHVYHDFGNAVSGRAGSGNGKYIVRPTRARSETVVLKLRFFLESPAPHQSIESPDPHRTVSRWYDQCPLRAAWQDRTLPPNHSSR